MRCCQTPASDSCTTWAATRCRRPVVALLWAVGACAVMFSLPGLFEQLFRGAMAALVGHRLGVPDVVVALFLFGGATVSTLVYAARSE